MSPHPQALMHFVTEDMSHIIRYLNFSKGVYIFSGGYCDNGWHHYDGSCYSVGSAEVDFPTATSLCIDNGATLASVTSLEENDFLKQL